MRNIDDGEKKETIGASQPPGRQPTAKSVYHVSNINIRHQVSDIKYHVLSIRCYNISGRYNLEII